MFGNILGGLLGSLSQSFRSQHLNKSASLVSTWLTKGKRIAGKKIVAIRENAHSADYTVFTEDGNKYLIGYEEIMRM